MIGRAYMDPINTIIVFDLHGVIFTPDWTKVFELLCNYDHKLYLISCGFRPRLVYKSLKLLLNNPTDEEFFALFKLYCPKFLPLAVDLMNAHKPVEPMVQILQELKFKGYALHVASNIGPNRFKFLCCKYPLIMNLFEKVKTTSGDLELLIKKPDIQFFKEYQKECNPENKPIIFVDDKKENIVSAQLLGFSGVRFKNVAQLLVQLNMLLK